MSLKVHETDELHSPHVHSLKPFPGVVLVNHFPPPVPANVLSFKVRGERNEIEKKLHLASGVWPEAAHQTFFSTRKTLSALAIESFSFSLWSCVNLLASRVSPPLKLPSMLVCCTKTKLSLFHNVRRSPSQMESCMEITSSDSTSLYFSLRKPTIWLSLSSFFRVNCLSFLHESKQCSSNTSLLSSLRKTELSGIVK